nr:ATP-binding cassette domain-containing protein [Limosilactobacillus reuteri]
MMKKSTIMKGRLDKAIEDRQGLLQEVEKVVPLTINLQPTHHQTLLSIDKLSLNFPGHPLCSNLSLKVGNHEQVILCGNNGNGKSSLFHAILGDFNGTQDGQITIGSNIKISVVRQNYIYNHGSLQDFAKNSKIDYDTFLNLLRKLGMVRSTFNVPIEQMSIGQQKKVELARSLAQPVHLYLRDEPLNYLDTYNQEQIIKLIQEIRPPMLIIEHNKNFIDHVATRKIQI